MGVARLTLAVVTAFVAIAPMAPRARAAAPCPSGVTLTLHPGVAGQTGAPSQVAPDIPAGPFTVSLPLYSDATPVSPLVGDPMGSYPLDPYLQTAVGEYESAAAEKTVMKWYVTALTSCGWRASGEMRTNSNVLAVGRDFTAAANPNLQVQMTFGVNPSGGTYIGYAAEEITYPPRPANSYLRGHFRLLRIALGRARSPGNPPSSFRHVTISTHRTIARLVAAINSLTQYYSVRGICMTPNVGPGPARIAFVRANGTVVHACESNPGACGALSVNGVRWLNDTGKVWKLILRDISGQG